MSDEDGGQSLSMMEPWLTGSSRIGFIILLSVICLVAFVGNGLVLLIAIKSSKMRTTNNCFIFNLAFCDFVVGCFGIPVILTNLLADRWVLGSTMCDVSALIDNLVMMESIWTLAALSAFRAMSVLDPFRVKQRSIRKKVLILLALLWVLVGMFVAAPTYGWSSYSYSIVTFNCGVSPDSFFVTFLVFVLFLPIFVVVISYVIILSIALTKFKENPNANDKRRFFTLSYWKNRNSRSKADSRVTEMKLETSCRTTLATPPSTPKATIRAMARNSGVIGSVAMPSNNSNGKIGKLVKTKSKLSLKIFSSRSVKSSIRVLIIVGVFLVCVVPFLTIAFIIYVNHDFMSVLSLHTAFGVYILSLSHSAINPCVYGLFDERFREAYKSLFIRPPKAPYAARNRSVIHRPNSVVVLDHLDPKKGGEGPQFLKSNSYVSRGLGDQLNQLA